MVGGPHRAFHRPPHPGRARREHDAFQHKQDSHTDEEVGERYGPHRMVTSRYRRFFAFSAAKRLPALPDLLWPAGTLRLRRGRGCPRRPPKTARGGGGPEELRIGPQEEAGGVSL